MVAAAGGSGRRLVPVRLIEEQHAAETRQELPPPAPPSAPSLAKPVSMESEFPDGVGVRVDETVSQAALRRMVADLRG